MSRSDNPLPSGVCACGHLAGRHLIRHDITGPAIHVGRHVGACQHFDVGAGAHFGFTPIILCKCTGFTQLLRAGSDNQT